MTRLPSPSLLRPAWLAREEVPSVAPLAGATGAVQERATAGGRLDAAALEAALEQLRHLQSLVAQGVGPSRR
jgi:hypothetical protein